MRYKASIVLFKFLQGINIKKIHEYKLYILVINIIFKKLISLLLKIVIKKSFFIPGWFN